MEKGYTLISPCFFGMEKMLANEIKNLGFEIVKTEDGRVTYKTDEYGIAKANMWLRCAERVHLKIAEFEAKSFDELFEGTKRINWAKYIPYGAQFPITKASSIKSKLHSIPDIQSIVKKAVVESLKKSYLETGLIKEDKEKYPIYVFIHKDKVTLTIDTSGSSLHKRGYRANALDAPLKETLAAAMIELSYWNKDRVLMDPFCGSGTIPIEAAMIARNIAPGLNRHFASEKWDRVPEKLWKEERKKAYAAIDYDCMPEIYGSDIDPAAIELAKSNAELAGVDDCITFEVKPVQELELYGDYGCLITNPPYGERLGDMKTVEDMYRSLGGTMHSNETWSTYVITSMEYFEKLFGKKASAKRKLFNAWIKTDYYQFYGPRPPKK